jgi:hypothetical protein
MCLVHERRRGQGRRHRRRRRRRRKHSGTSILKFEFKKSDVLVSCNINYVCTSNSTCFHLLLVCEKLLLKACLLGEIWAALWAIRCRKASCRTTCYRTIYCRSDILTKFSMPKRLIVELTIYRTNLFSNFWNIGLPLGCSFLVTIIPLGSVYWGWIWLRLVCTCMYHVSVLCLQMPKDSCSSLKNCN